MNEKELISKVLSDWDSAYSSKTEQKQFMKIILNKIKALEKSIHTFDIKDSDDSLDGDSSAPSNSINLDDIKQGDQQ